MRQMIWRFCIAGLLLSTSAFTAGCGPGRQAKPEAQGGEDVDIDALLADENKDQQQADEAEVLRLLGITPSTEKKDSTAVQPRTTQTATTPPSATETPSRTEPTDPRLEELKSQVAQLEQQLDSKDEAIQKLRDELQQREAQLTQLRSQARASQVSSATRTQPSMSGSQAGNFKDRYQSALQTYYARRYQDAIQMFRALLQEDDRNPLADNAQYWIGECYYGLGNYSQAIAEFEKVFAFPNSNKADDAQLKLGVTYLRLGNQSRARDEFQRLIANYPDSEYVSTARRYLSKLQG